MSLLHPAWHRTHPKKEEPHKDPWVHDMHLLIRAALGPDPIREAWQNWDLWIVVVQNNYNGLWYFAPYNCHDPKLLGRHTRSKEWAMLLAQDHCTGIYVPTESELFLAKYVRRVDGLEKEEARCA